ncbi:hypothetical protein EJ07DRAFT_138316, partial [Lizonia empirigonia]
QQLEQIGDEFTSAITEAAAAAIPQLATQPKSKPWWNQDLQLLRTSMLNKQRLFQRELAASSIAEAFLWKRDYLLARNVYLQAIKAAKQDHWNRFLEKEDAKSIYKAMAYTKSTTSQSIPAIQLADRLEDTFKGKCSAFRTTLFPPPPASSAIQWNTYQQGNWRLPHQHDNCRVSKIETSASSIPKSLESIAVQHREALLSLSQCNGLSPRSYD